MASMTGGTPERTGRGEMKYIKGNRVSLNVVEARKFGLPDWYGSGTVLVNSRSEMVHVKFDEGPEIKLHREYLTKTRARGGKR